MNRRSADDIEDLSDQADVVDDPKELPFAVEPTPDDQVISSLDGRPELVEQVRSIVSEEPASSSPAEPKELGVDTSSEPAPVLVVQSPKGTMETRYEIETPRFLIGKGDCDLVLDDPFVSPWHAQLFRRRGALILEDMGSKNGVYLRIADDLTLEDGDQIVVGRQRLVFRTSFGALEEDDATEPRTLGAPWVGPPARLVRYLEEGQVGGVYPLSSKTTIGATKADVTFPDDALLSAPHAAIRRDGEKFVLRDADSDSGTFIRIANAVELIDGDCFLVGRTRVRLTIG